MVSGDLACKNHPKPPKTQRFLARPLAAECARCGSQSFLAAHGSTVASGLMPKRVPTKTGWLKSGAPKLLKFESSDMEVIYVGWWNYVELGSFDEVWEPLWRVFSIHQANLARRFKCRAASLEDGISFAHGHYSCCGKVLKQRRASHFDICSLPVAFLYVFTFHTLTWGPFPNPTHLGHPTVHAVFTHRLRLKKTHRPPQFWNFHVLHARHVGTSARRDGLFPSTFPFLSLPDVRV